MAWISFLTFVREREFFKITLKIRPGLLPAAVTNKGSLTSLIVQHKNPAHGSSD